MADRKVREAKMLRKRKVFTSEFKAKVSIEAIKGEKTVNELSKDYGIHFTQIAKWKKYTLEHISELFDSPRGPKQNNDQELVDTLYRQIGKLQVELDFLKKKFDRID